jgi:hypothetical protein
MNALRKIQERTLKFRHERASRVAGLPAVPQVIIDANYINPITLNVPRGTVVYQLKNRTTGRVDYYDKETFKKLIKAFKGDYNLLMMNPKEPIPGARNPVTRGPIYPRNVRRVAIKLKKKTPNPNAAAKKIQSAVRKHLSKKRKTPNKARSK